MALRFGDLAGRHLERDLGPAFLSARRARKRREVEPFVRFDEVDGHAATAGRLSQAKFEQCVDVAGFGIGDAAPEQELRSFLTNRTHVGPLFPVEEEIRGEEEKNG